MTDCDRYFKTSLFLVGEIGGNDIIAWYNAYKNVTQIREIVPLIVESITTTTAVCYIYVKFILNTEKFNL